MPSLAETQAFQKLLNSISARAAAAVQALWNRYANADSQTRWEAIQEAFPDVLDPFMSSAEVITAEWYKNLNPESLFPVEIPPPVDLESLKANARFAMTTTDAAAVLVGAATRQVFNASRRTTYYNMRNEGVRYARLASEDACAFCKVLSTRTSDEDGLYLSEQSATTVVGRNGRPRGTRDIGQEYHDNCNCIPVPIRGDDTYEPPDYVKEWQDQYSDAPPGGMNEKANYLRRQSYPDQKDAFNARRRELYAEKVAAQQAADSAED